jgi:hypothetical protein
MDDVMPDAVDERDVGTQPIRDQAVHLTKIILHQSADSTEVHATVGPFATGSFCRGQWRRIDVRQAEQGCQACHLGGALAR